MGHLYILKDTGYQEYRDLLEAGIKIKDMDNYLKHHRDEELLLNENKQSKKTIIKITSFLVILLIFVGGFYYTLTKFDLFSLNDPKVSVEGIVSK